MTRIRTALIACLASAACGETAAPARRPPPPPPPTVTAPVADAAPPVAEVPPPYTVPKRAEARFVGEGIVGVHEGSTWVLLDSDTARVLTELEGTDYPNAAGGVVFAFAHPGVVVARPYGADPRPTRLVIPGLRRIELEEQVFEVALEAGPAKLGIVPLEGDHVGAVVPLEGTTNAKAETARSRDHLLAVQEKDEILLFALPSGRPAGRIPTPNAPHANIAFSPDGKWIYLDDSRRGMLVDVAQRKVARAFDAALHNGAFSADGKLFANPTKDVTAVEVFSLPELKRVRRFTWVAPTCKVVGCPQDQRPAMDYAGVQAVGLTDDGHYDELLSISYSRYVPEDSSSENDDAIVLRRDGVVRRIEPDAPRGARAYLTDDHRRVIVDGYSYKVSIHSVDGKTPPVEISDAYGFSVRADEKRLLVRTHDGGIRMLAWTAEEPTELWHLDPRAE